MNKAKDFILCERSTSQAKPEKYLSGHGASISAYLELIVKFN